MVADRYLGFLKLKFLTAMHFMPNFVEIGHTVAEISQFFAHF